MKKIGLFKKYVLPGVLAMAGLFSSCSLFDDFLTVYPTNQITGEQFWETQKDLESVLASCYKQMISADVEKRMMAWGEVRSDNFILLDQGNEDLMDIMNANLLPTNSWFTWDAFYKGIGYCNLVLSKGEEVISKDPGFTYESWKPVAAECKALRALYYFYLVRAFRDVPLVTKANDTSEGARDPIAQTPQQDILTFLINDLDTCKDQGMTNYGSDMLNRGRITRDAIYTILADLYLWRAAKNASPDSVAKYGDMSQNDYKKCIECCNFVINSKFQDFQKGQTRYWGQNDASKTPFPLLENRVTGRFTDDIYGEMFGEGNSAESIFELQHDENTNPHSAVQTFYGYQSTALNTGYVGGSSIVQALSSKCDPSDLLYAKTDVRYVESIYYKQLKGNDQTDNYQVVKYIARDVNVVDSKDVHKQSGDQPNVTYGSLYTDGHNGSNWIIYRVSDVMLMKAEALAYLQDATPTDLTDAFNLVKAIYDRANPGVEAKDALLPGGYQEQTNMQDLVMRERHREFFGEGKRWFDLVRMAQRDGTTVNMLNQLVAKYSNNASSIKAKLGTLNSLFNPVSKSEMKINTALVQNPVWQDDEDIVRN